MAVAKPFGFALFRTAGVNATNEQATTYSIPTSDASNAYYVGDSVKPSAGGDANGIPQIVKDTTGTGQIQGIMQGIINPFPGGVSVPSLVGSALPLEVLSVPATKLNVYYVLVCEDQDQMYYAQGDGSSGAGAVASACNKNSSITVANGATAQSASGSSLTETSFATNTATFPMRLVGLQQIANNTYGAFAFWICRVNNSAIEGSQAGT